KSLASVFTSKFLAVAFGRPVDINIGKSDALISALGADKNEKLSLVAVEHVQLEEICIPASLLLILPGDGEEITPGDKFCGNDKNLRKWALLPERKLPALHVGAVSLLQLRGKKRMEVKEVSLRFGNVQLNGSIISMDMYARWSENILGLDVVLLDETFHFEFDFGLQNPYPVHLADISGPFGIPISIDATISAQLNPNQVCADLRASWIGGNVGTRACQGF
ncbi:MAG TPA: hypothetical protein VK206_11645, partial [Anaerolineales bacterium]|nr:hypothetical protein [Anaerolineales bacterium]